MEFSSLKKKLKDKKFAGGCSRDVIRHKLVGQIVKAFDKYEGQKKDKKVSKGSKYHFKRITGQKNKNG